MNKDIGLGDYQVFFNRILQNLDNLGISIQAYPLSHLGYRTKTLEQYQIVLRQLLKHSAFFAENIHNGRNIAKLMLKEALILQNNFRVSMIELMPPKPDREYDEGFEHCGVVLGNDFDQFNRKYKSVLTGQQDQGPFCQPTYIRFVDGSRVKFYHYSLKRVIQLEGGVFTSYSGQGM
jgi:predicted metalloenzyme YecM